MLTAIHRDPFSVAPNIYSLPEGVTLAEMAERVTTLPQGWPRHEHDVITVNGQVAPRALWSAIRPKPGVEVGFHAPPMGGEGEDTGKQVLSLVASIALTALSGGIVGGQFLGGLTGAAAGEATILSRLIGGAVLVGGSALLTSLAPPPSGPETDDREGPGTASAQGNSLEPNAPFPRVVGTRKIYPRYASEPLSYYDGQDEVVEAVVGLAGPHKLEDIRIGDAPIEGMSGVEYETREGFPGIDPLTLTRRYARTNAVRSELRGHITRDDAANQLESPTGDLDDALPQAKVISTRTAPDEFWIDMNFPQGVSQNDYPNDALRVPFRLRMRRKGESTWRNLPELHYSSARVGETRLSVHFVWRGASVESSAASSGVGWVEARTATPGQEVEPTNAGWSADSYFVKAGGGDDYVDQSNPATTGVQNVFLSQGKAEINLDRGEWEPGQYEVELKRGYAFFESDYEAATYEIKNDVRDPFFYESVSGRRIAQSKEGLNDKLIVVRGASVWNELPVQGGDLALIAIRARNVSIEKLSVLASGYVRDWDGSGWTDWTTTSNPAPHMRDVLGGMLNAVPVPEEIIDDPGLVTWRTACASAGYTVDAICEGLSLADVANLVAGAGYAKPYMSEIWGVVRDYDRSAETPVQVFTPHNSSNFGWAKGFPRRPDGLRITFADSEKDYETRQIIHPPGSALTEQVSYDGLVTEADCRARADYDLKTSVARGTFYSFDAPAEAIKCRRGDLVYAQHDMLSARVASGRIVDIVYDASGKVESVFLDNDPPEIGGLAWADIGSDDWGEIEDVSTIEQRAGVILRGGGVTVHPCTISGTKINLNTPATLDDLGHDDLAQIGPLGREAHRLVVFSMQPREELVWSITAVDEAPELWT